MRRRYPLTALLTVFLAGPALAGPEMIPETDLELTGHTAPAIALGTLDGGDFTLEDHRGQVLVLSFWASWCGPCRLELPELDKLQQRRSDVSVFAINVDRDRAAAERFLAGLDLSLPVVLDSQSIALGEYGVMSMPTTFLLDANGTVKYHKAGFSREKGLAELEAAIDRVAK